VPVISVGCERGVHYYAMQYIDGQTLAAVIAELRQQAGLEQRDPYLQGSEVVKELISGRLAPPNRAAKAGLPTMPYIPGRGSAAPSGESIPRAGLSTEHSIKSAAYLRTVVNMALQAVEALEHAHAEGVVHRDVKPANLLVDLKGNLWITDFGLAHCQSQAGLTMTGDLVGTLRYMSPEQALARRVSVDHRTDIYSLGVTLYELLTLEVAFPGRDREEVLRRIAFEEPPAPRHWNKAIPKELETIVLKAMEKSPEARYATAQELADDLRRFLEDRPIRAKRPTLLQRAAKWARRHKTAMRAAAAVLFVAVAGLTTSTLLIWQEKEQTKTALAQARSNAATAYKILDKIYLATIEKRLPRLKGLTAEDRQLLEDALTSYEEFAKQDSSDPSARLISAGAYHRVAIIHETLGQTKEAVAADQQAVTVSAKLVDDFPDPPAYRQVLARSYSSLGGVSVNSLNSPPLLECQQAYAKAVELQEQLVREFPENLEYQQASAIPISASVISIITCSAASPPRRNRLCAGLSLSETNWSWKSHASSSIGKTWGRV
jgi:tetratricopeptide (TPR) repeat protein